MSSRTNWRSGLICYSFTLELKLTPGLIQNVFGENPEQLAYIRLILLRSFKSSSADLLGLNLSFGPPVGDSPSHGGEGGTLAPPPISPNGPRPQGTISNKCLFFIHMYVQLFWYSSVLNIFSRYCLNTKYQSTKYVVFLSSLVLIFLSKVQ